MDNIKHDDPKKHVSDFLKKEGYPFEMYVAKKFRDAGFEVYQSMLYTDEDTDKEREIDVVAYYNREFGDIEFEFKVIIECKYTKGLWVFFSGENAGYDALYIDNFYCANYAGIEMLNKLGGAPNFENQEWFKIKRRYGYSLVETRQNNAKEDNRTPYIAVMKLLGALRNDYERDKEFQFHNQTYSIRIPVIALQGKLFECYLNQGETEVINEIDEGQLLYKSHVYPDTFPLIEVVTKDNVGQLAVKLKSDFEQIFKDYWNIMEPLTKQFPRDPYNNDIT